MVRKGLGQSLDAFIGILVLIIFAIGAFTVPPGQDWNDYQREISSQDISYALKDSGHMEQFMAESNLGGLRTAVYEVSDRDFQLSGTVQNLPFTLRVGFFTPPSRVEKTSLQSVESGDRCYNTQGINELQDKSEARVVRSVDDNFNNLEDRTGARIYLADTDPQSPGAYNGQLDFDTLWIDHGADCSFSDDEGPFYIDDVFVWEEPSNSDPAVVSEFKESSVRPSQSTETYVGNITTHTVPQIKRFRDTFQQDIMGISSDAQLDSFTFEGRSLTDYDILVFRDRSNLPYVEQNEDRVKEYAKQGSILFLMNPEDQDLDDQDDILRYFGFREAGLELGSGPRTDCPSTGSVVIDQDCTFGPGTYLLDNLTVESGVTVTVDNTPERCDTTFRGYGCRNLSYGQYSPKLLVKGDVEIDGDIVADSEGFRNATSAGANRGGPGAGVAREVSGGAGYGGEGGDSDSYDDGGPPYGSQDDATRLGSAGGWDRNGVTGGSGGGSIWITSEQEIRIDGTVSADGGYGSGGAGGGSGGSVRIEAHQLSGSGQVSAEGGGNGNRGGGGAGGRVALIRETGPSDPFAVTVSGGTSGSSGEQGDDGTLYTDQRNFNMSIGINFSQTTSSQNLKSYVLGQELDLEELSLYPEANMVSEDTGLVSERKLAYLEDVDYRSAALNATNESMTPVSDPTGEPDTACDTTTKGKFDFFPENSSIQPYDVINVELGSNQTYCDNRDIRGALIDFNRNGDFSDPGEGPYLNTESFETRGKEFRVSTVHEAEDSCGTGECLKFVFQGEAKAELVNYVEGNGQEKLRVVRASYEDEYSEADRKFIIGLMYWLRNGKPYDFGDDQQSTLSTNVFGGIDGPQYLPYRVNMRWNN
jgi:hypothetical protein